MARVALVGGLNRVVASGEARHRLHYSRHVALKGFPIHQKHPPARVACREHGRELRSAFHGRVRVPRSDTRTHDTVFMPAGMSKPEYLYCPNAAWLRTRSSRLQSLAIGS